MAKATCHCGECRKCRDRVRRKASRHKNRDRDRLQQLQETLLKDPSARTPNEQAMVDQYQVAQAGEQLYQAAVLKPPAQRTREDQVIIDIHHQQVQQNASYSTNDLFRRPAKVPKLQRGTAEGISSSLSAGGTDGVAVAGALRYVADAFGTNASTKAAPQQQHAVSFEFCHENNTDRPKKTVSIDVNERDKKGAQKTLRNLAEELKKDREGQAFVKIEKETAQAVRNGTKQVYFVFKCNDHYEAEYPSDGWDTTSLGTAVAAFEGALSRLDVKWSKIPVVLAVRNVEQANQDEELDVLF